MVASHWTGVWMIALPEFIYKISMWANVLFLNCILKCKQTNSAIYKRNKTIRICEINKLTGLYIQYIYIYIYYNNWDHCECTYKSLAILYTCTVSCIFKRAIYNSFEELEALRCFCKSPMAADSRICIASYYGSFLRPGEKPRLSLTDPHLTPQ